MALAQATDFRARNAPGVDQDHTVHGRLPGAPFRVTGKITSFLRDRQNQVFFERQAKSDLS